MDIKELNKAAQISTTALMAIACAKDNGWAWNMLPLAERKLWGNFADNIVEIMRNSDEPRFTLYDYLDAAINHGDTEWPDIANKVIELVQKSNSDAFDEALDLITELAQKSRDIYEKDHKARYND